MTNYGITYSIDPPQTIEITDTKVFVTSNIQTCLRDDGSDHIVKMYSYDLVEYDKNEYINILAKSIVDITALEEELQAAKIILGVE